MVNAEDLERISVTLCFIDFLDRLVIKASIQLARFKFIFPTFLIPLFYGVAQTRPQDKRLIKKQTAENVEFLSCLVKIDAFKTCNKIFYRV